MWLVQRFWRWYFWGTPPIPYGRRLDPLKTRLWYAIHPRWVRDLRHQALIGQTMQRVWEAEAEQRRQGRLS
jgi:hypothetical protein